MPAACSTVADMATMKGDFAFQCGAVERTRNSTCVGCTDLLIREDDQCQLLDRKTQRGVACENIDNCGLYATRSDTHDADTFNWTNWLDRAGIILARSCGMMQLVRQALSFAGCMDRTVDL